MSYLGKNGVIINLSSQVMIELQNNAKKAARWSVKSKQELPKLPIEMQIVLKHLELAEHNGKCRFNDAEISEIIGLINVYKSHIPVTDLVKQLLKLGTEKGNPLSAQEITDFLKTTAIMNKQGQSRVMTFMEAFKETVSDTKKASPDTNAMNNSADLLKYKSYTSKLEARPDSISNFINLRKLNFAYSVASCQKPDIMARIAHRTGITLDLTDAPNLFIEIYELSDENLDLIQDLSRCFYFWETERILSELKTQNYTGDLSKYESLTYSTDYHTLWFSSPGLAMQRDRVLQRLGLTGKIELADIHYNRKVKTFDGSFEQGKRR